ncbi:bifunctional metallophosphatase/5'-nucleotidase [Natronosalvus caseinilyticus]|uniref:bifunctional metallophosphatase/5'-nucleotidase n=1 Tax=Natronosalvus caseinilyticus TaxID=2953747 RepID=UPI0028B13475|nr:bifunctional UDP-sugar hydrolase/5'-nucleotidase [Natronosalvus caseinilyticus]
MPARVLQYSDVENACDEPARIGRLATALHQYRDADTIVVGTGDNTAPGVLPLVMEGRQALEFYDAVDPDLETFGNHDFDFGVDATREVVRRSPQAWLSANVQRNGGPFGSDVGVRPWTVLERNETRIGFTGVTTPRTVSLNPVATDIDVHDPVETARAAIDSLRDEGVDYVVVCSHLGRGDDALARQVDADVVLGGHVPSARNEVVEGTLLTRPGDGGTAIVDLSFERDGPTATIRRTTGLEPHVDVVRSFEALQAETGLDDVIARVDEPLDRSETTLFGGEAKLGNFVTDAYRWKTGADVAIQNSGGLRTGTTLSGDVTVADVISLVPFEEPVAVAEVSGSTLEAIFEGSAGLDLGFAEPDWWHAQVSGAVLEWDPTDHSVTVDSVGGDPLDPDQRYRVATSDYLFHTDDEFPALDPADRVERTEVCQYDVLVEYARRHGIDPAIEGRVRRLESRLESSERTE